MEHRLAGSDSRPAVSVADICLPPSLHIDVVTAAAEAGPAIYCEKPLTTSAGGALALTELTESRGLSTMIGFNMRWSRHPVPAGSDRQWPPGHGAPVLRPLPRGLGRRPGRLGLAAQPGPAGPGALADVGSTS